MRRKYELIDEYSLKNKLQMSFPRVHVDTSHAWILHHHLALDGGVSGGDPDLVHLHSLLAAVLFSSLAETTANIFKHL